VSWDNPTDRTVVGLELLREMEDQMVNIKHNLKDSQDRKKIYVDKNITRKEYKVGDHVFLIAGQEKLFEIGEFFKACNKILWNRGNPREDWYCYIHACITCVHVHS
jgi:hypothetical protein